MCSRFGFILSLDEYIMIFDDHITVQKNIKFMYLLIENTGIAGGKRT